MRERGGEGRERREREGERRGGGGAGFERREEVLFFSLPFPPSLWTFFPSLFESRGRERAKRERERARRFGFFFW